MADLKENLHTDHMVLNMGPSHPATHGTVKFLLTLDGETVVNLIRERLFLTDDSPPAPESLLENPTFQELVASVQDEVNRQRPGQQRN